MTYIVPPDWRPSEAIKAFAEGVALAGGIDEPAEMEKFRTFDFPDPVRNPDKAYVGWLRQALEHSARNGRNGKKAPAEAERQPSRVERMRAEVEVFRLAHPGDYQRLFKYLEQHRWWESAGGEYQLEQMAEAIPRRHQIFEFLDKEGREF